MGSRRYNYHYCDIIVPPDCAEGADERANIAFLEAEEQFHSYRLPAIWYIVHDDGETVRVGRKSYHHKGD